ncbi:MAG TPA: conjugal transfer protein MobC [Pelobium sp.]|nr:conjugal transfer protein MobC [Pelobium sp.]
MISTGENEQGLRKIVDFIRMLSITILLIHFYIVCHSIFLQAGLTNNITNRVLEKISRTHVFSSLLVSKAYVFILLLIFLFAKKVKRKNAGNIQYTSVLLLMGVALFFCGQLVFQLQKVKTAMMTYMMVTSTGYLTILFYGGQIALSVKSNLLKDVFNRENESFPQEERKLMNEYSVNLPAKYRYRNIERKSWINITNPFRGILVTGTPGSGKTYFAIRHIITQHIDKGFSMFLYDFKFDDLTKIAYNRLLKANANGTNKAKFFFINFDDLSKTHRCNPLNPDGLGDITDATESARTIMLGLNKEWIKKQGDFFVESPINFLTAIIWYLKKYEDGRFCTLPHVIELMQVGYDDLFTLLNQETEIEALINPFISAWKNQAFDQLEGQVASAKISLARLVSPSIYYVLSGNDFTLDINNPDEPKIVCIGNNPQKQQVYGAVLSLYVSRLIKLVNQKNKIKSSLIFDEFPTVYLNNIDSLIATARSNKVSTTLAVQDFSQLKKDYGKEQADVLMNIVGNVISGQVTGETAKHLSERFGKIKQQRQSVTITTSNKSTNNSTQLDFAIPVSRIASLSSGEFVGMVADDPSQKIDLKLFHNQIQNNHQKLAIEDSNFKDLPALRTINNDMIKQNYLQIKQDIQEILAQQLRPSKGISNSVDYENTIQMADEMDI